VHVIKARALIPAFRARDARIPIHGHDLVSDTFRGNPKARVLGWRSFARPSRPEDRLLLA